MNNGLQEINELEGVWGNLVCNNNGDVIASAPPSGLNKSNLENVSRHCVEMLSAGTELITELGEMVIYFEQRRLFVLDMKKAVMIIFCTPSIDISLLRMTINVATSSWKEDKKIQQILADNFVERL